MSRVEAWFLHLAVVLVTVTGVALAWMKYGMKSEDPFAVVNHPLQPVSLHLHVLFAPLLVFGLGWILNDHILLKFRSRAEPRRPSGSTAMWIIAPMIVSGYLIQVVTAEWPLRAASIAHWVTSAVFAIAYAAHQWWKR